MSIFKKKSDKTSAERKPDFGLTVEENGEIKNKVMSEWNMPKNIGRTYSIDKKVENFVDWYSKIFVNGNYSESGEFSLPRDMINSIEKMAVWYELRYPEYEVSRRYPGSAHENKYADSIFIKQNPAIKQIEEALDDDELKTFSESIDMIGWEDLLSPKTYFSSLPWDEKWFLERPRFYDKAINYPTENNRILEAVERSKKRCELKERFLDTVMYRIIERGGIRIGARRAFMFAQDFKRNIDIPMIYGVDYSDPGLREFINEYIKAGGRTDLECLVGYGSRRSDNEVLNTTTVQEMLQSISANCVDKYTEEETALHQRLVDALTSGLSSEETLQEEQLDERQQIEQKRLIRKLDKSRRR